MAKEANHRRPGVMGVPRVAVSIYGQVCGLACARKTIGSTNQKVVKFDCCSKPFRIRD